MKRIYLDYAASTPVTEEVLEAMTPYFREIFGNSSSLHSFGRESSKALDASRETIAKELGASFNEIIFTSSATEANNTILNGVIQRTDIKNPRIIISALEHESVLEAAEKLSEKGVEVIKISVSEDGILDLDELKNSINENTVLVAVTHASNTIGVIQPIEEASKVVKEIKEKNNNNYPLFYVDAAQSFPFEKVNVEDLGADSLTISGQKIYGPKGVGVLYIKESITPLIAPLMNGGTQEFSFRTGTVNIPAIVGCAKAVEFISENREAESNRLRELRDNLWTKLKERLPEIELNGSLEKRLPNNLNIYFPGKDGAEFMIALDQAGIAVSTGSACSVRLAKPPRAVLALGLGEERAKGSIRITLGYPTTEEEIQKVIEIITETGA